MRIYSLKHLVITSFGILGLFTLLGLLLGFISLPVGEKNIPPQTAYTISASSGNQYFSESYVPVTNQNLSADEKENISIYQKLNEGVVNITSVSYSYNWFLEPVPQSGTGSGSILNQDGYVLTNYHVIANAEKLWITLADGEEYEAKLIGVDPENDLAVLKFDPKGKKLVTIPLGTSQNLMVGNKVLAIGNPFGLERTLTTGIISGLGRPVKVNSNYVVRDMIQTDASINPGNSGGPLINTRGEQIGINTMIYSTSGGSIGIGFAIPIDIAKRVIPELIKYGKVERGWIDASLVQLFPQLVQFAKLPVSQGLLVSEVPAGGFAQKAGLLGGSKSRAVRYRNEIIYLGGDIIVEVDGIKIKSLADLYAALEDNKPGEIVKIKVNRNSSVVELKLELSKRPRNLY